MDQVLTNINKEDPVVMALQRDIVPMKQDLYEIKSKLSLGLPKSDQPKNFKVTAPVKTFTGRERELTLLHDKLQTNQNQVVVSQCASISGLGGMGKSELARRYAQKYRKYYGSCIWIDSETQSSITQSFRRLAEKLQIPITQNSLDGERNTLLIVEDIFERFSNSKSLFIFDNVNEYEEIKDFLPSNLSPNPTDEKATIIITSRHSDWDIGDEGDVGLILLDQFTPEEALSFVKKVLEIQDEDKSHDSVISELTKELCYFPLALRQAASYIKAKKCLASYIKAIEKYLVEFRDEKKERDLLKYKTKRDRYTETTYTTWQTTFRNMEKNEVNGPLAIRLVEVMAYLAADNIPLKGFIELAENKENLIEAVDILVKYSIITLNNEFEEYDKEYVWHSANIHRLVQQVIRLWLQEEKREEEVLGVALTQIHDYINRHHAATLWTYACDYITLINNYFCEIYEETKSYDQFLYVLDYLVEKGDVRTLKTVFDYLEGTEDLWKDLCSHILQSRFVECRHRYDYHTLRNITHEKHIKAVVLFHAEVSNALRHSNTKELELFLQSFDKYLMASKIFRDTALTRSARSGNLIVVKILAENMPDSLFVFKDYAFHTAICRKHREVAEYLHKTRIRTTVDATLTRLESACVYGFFDRVKSLVHTIPDITGTGVKFWRPLLLAAECEKKEIVNFFFNHEVYRSAMEDNGQTLCHYAAEYGVLQVVKYLIDNKLANVNGRNCNNETVLMAAAGRDRRDIVKYLLTDKTHDKVDINAFDLLGYTPLFKAVLDSNIEIASLLIEHGAAVDNVQNGNTLLGQLNISALHLAAACDCNQIVKFLIEECNADINMGLNTTFTAFQVAKYFGHKEICEFLIRKGADTMEWSEAHLKNITRILRSFCEEKKDIIGVKFNEYISIQYYMF